MKSYLSSSLASALLVVGMIQVQVVQAQDMGADPQQSSRARMAEHANASAQSATDISYGETQPANGIASQPLNDTSYGGVPDMTSQSGGPRTTPCVPATHCDIYFGR
ncbi:hypothetical protein [Paraburkholderia sp.]|uniref:hypothetical protein n=1 Tax=Paraburkholderia sp. TaxID=1926495 RepID=UPI00238D8190|nr:hypothetical protein [Paraburkholderia sp.]MDE1180568.1 hypothetical protein [Paraburkholderia sp.]